MATNTIAYPVGTLSDLVTSLEAALVETLADPKAKHVHRLRTTTRHIEAQLELLALLPGLPEHAKAAKRSQKLLGKLRRAAGRVRDLDVQYDLTSSKSRESQYLRKIFKRQRKEKADRLIKTIHKHQRKLVRTLEVLLKAVAPSESLALSAARLNELVLHWYIHNVPATPENPDQFHQIRKSAKLARYMAESATKPTQSTRELAQTFESLQQSAGHWHDWLMLSGIANRELGSSSPLARFFTRNCERALADYQRHLKSLPKALKV